MSLMDNTRKFFLFVILDAYVTKNSIEEFLSRDDSIIINKLLTKYKKEVVDSKISKYKAYLLNELNDIECFLNDENNIYFKTLGYSRSFFDKNLPKHKRKIEWFHSVDRYPFDFNIFFNDVNE